MHHYPPQFELPGAVYLPDGDGRFVSTSLTAGPWEENGQHAGASAALLAHCLEQYEVARASALRVVGSRLPVPQGTLTSEGQPPPPAGVPSVDGQDSPWLMFWHGFDSRPFKGERDEPARVARGSTSKPLHPKEWRPHR